jgi:hypothetical protein
MSGYQAQVRPGKGASYIYLADGETVGIMRKIGSRGDGDATWETGYGGAYSLNGS